MSETSHPLTPKEGGPDTRGVPVVKPWGNYTVLDEGEGYKVKRIVVNPGHRLSLQTHEYRTEHWLGVSGTGLTDIAELHMPLGPGDYQFVPMNCRHRVKNVGQGPLVFIEIQRGAYLGEDDIVRLEDDYGRA